MNERIEDLMYHAGLTAQGCWDSMDDYDHQAIKRFAELIVKECVDVLETEIDRLTEYGKSLDNENYKADVELCISKCIDNIMNLQEHFGIKNEQAN